MARLQILELPEGTGDDRLPFVLVVDQTPADEAAFEALRRDLSDDIAQRIGARAVLVFEETIDIPANDVSGYLGGSRLEYEVKVGDQDISNAIEADMPKVRDKDQELRAANEWFERLNAEAREARRALGRVRALHQPQPDGTGQPDGQQCRTCSQDGGDGYQYLVPWPCPTVRTLDGEQPATDA